MIIPLFLDPFQGDRYANSEATHSPTCIRSILCLNASCYIDVSGVFPVFPNQIKAFLGLN